tara:strand:+ start:312 stop:692 length:381 start_codon:yes stop_codon:yes gene_type:complete
MSYTPNAGPLFVGLVTSTQAGAATETTINFNEFRTSKGLYGSTSLNLTGLAFTDLTSTTGTGGLVGYGEHSPKSGGGFGADVTRTAGTLGCAGAIGCASLSSDDVIIRYKAYDANDVITSSHIFII